ncbi:MAG: hypothetical protein WBX25_16710 [Rhodomicrobium sp.]
MSTSSLPNIDREKLVSLIDRAADAFDTIEIPRSQEPIGRIARVGGPVMSGRARMSLQRLTSYQQLTVLQAVERARLLRDTVTVSLPSGDTVIAEFRNDGIHWRLIAVSASGVSVPIGHGIQPGGGNP